MPMIQLSQVHHHSNRILAQAQRSQIGEKNETQAWILFAFSFALIHRLAWSQVESDYQIRLIGDKPHGLVCSNKNDCLSLWVDHKRPSSAKGYNQTIFDTEGICRKTLQHWETVQCTISGAMITLGEIKDMGASKARAEAEHRIANSIHKRWS